MRRLYAVYDTKSKAYGPIVSATHDAVATRDFVAAVNAQGSSLAQFPQDFELHVVGEFADDGPFTEAEVQAALDLKELRPCVKGHTPRVVVTASAVVAMAGGKPELVKEA